MLCAARSISSILFILKFDRTSASGTFGVSNVAIGNNIRQNMSKASGCISIDPLVDTITGSITIMPGLLSCRVLTIAFIVATSFTIPIFTASGLMSSITAFICPDTISGLIA